MKQINGKHVTKVINWCFNFLADCQTIMQPNQLDENCFVCTIDIPKVDKEVIGIGSTRIEAIYHATKFASKLIDKYLEKNPSTQINNYFKGKYYIVEEDEDSYIKIRLSDHKLKR